MVVILFSGRWSKGAFPHLRFKKYIRMSADPGWFITHIRRAAVKGTGLVGGHTLIPASPPANSPLIVSTQRCFGHVQPKAASPHSLPHPGKSTPPLQWGRQPFQTFTFLFSLQHIQNRSTLYHAHYCLTSLTRIITRASSLLLLSFSCKRLLQGILKNVMQKMPLLQSNCGGLSPHSE